MRFLTVENAALRHRSQVGKVGTRKMAKYQIDFSCGHTEQRELYGPTKERQRKIEYFERSGDCTECYKARMRAQKDAEGPVIQLRWRRGDNALAEFVVFNSFSVKDTLKARGYKFSYDYMRDGSFLNMHARSEGAWAIRFEGVPAEITDAVTAEINWLKAQDWKFEDASTPMHGLMHALVEGKPEYLEVK